MTDNSNPMTDAELLWIIDDTVVMRPFEAEHAAATFAAVRANTAHLDRWILWSSTVQTEADAAATIAKYATKRASGTGFNNAIWFNDQLVGGVVCRELSLADRSAEIGYWLDERHTGRGLATIAATRATDYLIRVRGMHRVYMQCAVGNVKSRAIPERLGYTLEATLREAHWLNDRFVDQAVYGILDREWLARS
jgi:ribosomal-protein-serine acetyltransferase